MIHIHVCRGFVIDGLGREVRLDRAKTKANVTLPCLKELVNIVHVHVASQQIEFITLYTLMKTAIWLE